MKAFPEHIGWDNWGSIMLDTELFTPVVREACAVHGLSCGRIEAGFPGTNAVFLVDEQYVVKMYAPLDILDAETERICYRAMDREGIGMAPRLYGEGMLCAGGYNWPYVIAEYMPGEAVRDLWKGYTSEQRAEIGVYVGEWAREYHRIGDPFSDTMTQSRAGWERGIAGRIDATLAKLREGGAKPELLAQLSAFAKNALTLPRDIVLTHADLTEDHLLIAGERMSIIDFADSRMAFPCLEWMPLWFGMMERDAGAFSAYLASSGETVPGNVKEEALLGTVLHTYGAHTLLGCAGDVIRNATGVEEIFPLFPDVDATKLW